MSRQGTLSRKRLLVVALLLAMLGVPAIAAAPGAIAAPPDGPNKLADFEGGPPAGWFTYFGGSTVNTSTSVVGESDPLARPGQAGDNEILVSDFNVSDFGGFGQDLVIAFGGPQDWSSTAGFSFWFYGSNSGLVYQAEISDNRSNPNTDTSERFDYEFTDDTAGWRLISIPWSDFTRATDFQPGGAPDDGLTLTEVYAWAIVHPLGADTVYFDDFGIDNVIVDDFESGLAAGADADGVFVGFFTFQGAESSVAIETAAVPPAPRVPGSADGNNVMKVDLDVTSFAGFIHAFENEAVDTWVPQNWSTSSGLALWLYGTGSGTEMFIDLLENRNPGSTTDDAERWTVTISDDFTGWQYFEFPFADFTRKGVGNGAPNDGFELLEVHGWAFGTLGTGGPRTYYIDDVALFGIAEIPELAVQFTSNNFDIEEGTTGLITVKLNRALGDDDPDAVSVDYIVETVIAEDGKDFVQPPAGTLTFVKGGPSELSFPIETIDDAKYEDTERLILRLTNPVGALPGVILHAAANIVDNDPYDPLLIDDFELGAYQWGSSDGLVLTTPEITSGSADAVPGQGAFETVLRAGASAGPAATAVKQAVADDLSALLPTGDRWTDRYIQSALTRIEASLRPAYWASDSYLDSQRGQKVFLWERGAVMMLERAIEKGAPDPEALQAAIDTLVAVDGQLARSLVELANAIGSPKRALLIANANLMHADELADAGHSSSAITSYRLAWLFANLVIKKSHADLPAASFGTDFPIGEDWSASPGLSFWYYGSGSGEDITVALKDNRAPDPGPGGWSMVWSDEFNDPAGTPPNPDNWGYEIGDGTVNGIPGWGNSELQYYTDSTDNVATDGDGNLVITAKAAEGEQCYYGECEYTSARLLSWHRAEFAYGRIESRILVPPGEAGLWPAFWSLGTDIDLVDWPQTGEIDIMEYVSRIPDEIFGTIHGPGYSGGNAYGNISPIPEGVSQDYHTFAIEWQPDLIEWYLDGELFHTATPADVAPNEWVFNDPVFLLLNLAIGGNFGGSVSPDLTFPQSMKVDYVRVYQGPDTAERFEASFVDDVAGWQQVEIPFDAFSRSDEQPAGAPNDGLNLNEVWGYSFELPDAGRSVGTVMVDQVRLVAPEAITVANTAGSGPGSLRAAIATVASGGDITFDPSLAGGTIVLNGPLTIDKPVTIDAVDAPGLSLSGGGGDRVLIVDPTGDVTMRHLTLKEGFGFQLAGCVLNNGSLMLDHVTVTSCVMTTDAGDFWQGGGGIYSGDGASLTLIDSTVSGNNAGWSGGGIYSFFNTQTTIENSTISGNVSNDVGGGLRLLGNATIVNSTISGNQSTGWYGGAMFATDGVVDMTNTTVVGNVSPDFAPAAVFVGTFGPTSATLNVANSIIANNVNEGCFLAPFGAGPVAINSLGNNVFSDGTCFPIATDQVVADAGVAALGDNGGPTATHALLAGSPAIDAANNDVCPATDQRGVARDAACDVGSYEYVP